MLPNAVLGRLRILTDIEREIVLSLDSGASDEEVARKLRITPEAVSMAKWGALNKLRLALHSS